VARLWLSCVVVVVPGHAWCRSSLAPWQRRNPIVMIKRILLALTLAASLGGAVVGCNTPAATTSPAVVAPSTAPVSTPAESGPAASDAAPSVAPSSS
jgi:hypothetical protein